MKLKFLGAAGGVVTGSCYLLSSYSGQTVLVDCGLFQGTPETDKLNYLPLDCDCAGLSAVFLTHAHLDHCGRLPILTKHGFNGNIWMTAPTRDLAELTLLDSAKIAKEDGKVALYDKDQAIATINQMKTLEYDSPLVVADFTITVRDAGHILGSSSIEIVDNSSPSEKIVFSGDLGNSPQDLVKPTEPIASADYAVMESTYGGRSHPEEDPVGLLRSEINTIENTGGTLLIPAFSLERSQELLHIISHLKKNNLIKSETPVFLDSPMAEKATRVFEKYFPLFNPEIQLDKKSGDPFSFPGLSLVETREQSDELINIKTPKVIIAGSGMMAGGRIMNHALQYLPLASTRVFIVGYQAEGTLGRALLEGQKQVIIEGASVEVAASINQTQAMSSHADQPRLLKWIENIKGLKKIFLVHGEQSERQELSAKITTIEPSLQIFLPDLDEEAIF